MGKSDTLDFYLFLEKVLRLKKRNTGCLKSHPCKYYRIYLKEGTHFWIVFRKTEDQIADALRIGLTNSPSCVTSYFLLQTIQHFTVVCHFCLSWACFLVATVTLCCH